MRYYTCYRLFAAVDISLSLICIFLWWIFSFQAKQLVSLQFEYHKGNNSLTPYAKNHSGILKFFGTRGSMEGAGEMLRDLYEEVHLSCNEYYKRFNIKQHGDKQHDKLLFILEVCVILQITSMTVFLVLGIIMVITTSRGMQASKRVVVPVFIIQIVFYFTYAGAGLFIGIHPQFCALVRVLKAYRLKVALYVFLYKPYFSYVIYQYYKDISNETDLMNRQNSGSSVSPSITDDASSLEIYELDKALGIPGSEDVQVDQFNDTNNNNNVEEKKQDDPQVEDSQVAPKQSLESSQIGIQRKRNFTNIPQDHTEEVDTNQIEQVVNTPSRIGSFFKGRFFGSRGSRGKENDDLRKVAPMKNSLDSS